MHTSIIRSFFKNPAKNLNQDMVCLEKEGMLIGLIDSARF